MGLLEICYVLLIISKCITTSYAADVPPSPCPGVFEYRIDNNNNLYGYITAAPPINYNNLILLDVQLSIANRLQGFNGKIESLNARSENNDVLQNKLIYYRLDFPNWQNIPPRITKIAINENQICFGNPIDVNEVPGATTLNLQHTQKISVPLSIRPNNVQNLVSVYSFDGTRQTNNPFNTPNSKPANLTWNFNPQTPNDDNAESKINNEAPSPSAFSYVGNDGTIINYPLNTAPDSKPITPTFNLNPETSYTEPKQDIPWHPLNQQEPRLFHSEDVPLPPQNPVPPEVPTVPPTSSEAPELWQPPTRSVCGLSTNANALVIRGNKIVIGQHPWIAALFKQDDEGLKFTCGSTLISKKHVVTAAHCVKSIHDTPKPEDFWVVIGRENIRRWSNDGARIIQAQSIHPHPESKFNHGDADIAVIRLREEVTFTNLIKPICLWTSDQNQKLIIKKRGVVVGWGKDENGKISTPEPRQVTFPIVNEEDCLRSNIGFNYITSNRTFCAGYRNGSGPCNGDSGSGFFMKKNERWTLRGVVSTALSDPDGECEVREYTVFVDAAAFTEWLLSFLN